MPPRGNVPKLIEIKVSVPEHVFNRVTRIREGMGLTQGEFNRIAWILGAFQLSKGDNVLKYNDLLDRQLAQPQLEEGQEGDEPDTL